MRLTVVRSGMLMIAAASAGLALAPGRCGAQVTTPQPRLILRAQAKAIRSLAYSPDGAMLVAGGNDGRVRVYDPSAGRLLAEGVVREGLAPGDRELIISRLAFSPDGRTLLAVDEGGLVQPWTIRAGQGAPTLLKRDFYSVPSPAVASAFSRDGRFLKCDEHDDRVYFRDVATGRLLAEMRTRLELPSFRAWSLAMSRDAEVLAVAGMLDRDGEEPEGIIQIWDLGERRLRTVLQFGVEPRSHGLKLSDLMMSRNGVLFSPDASALAVIGRYTIVPWDVAGGKPRAPLEANHAISCLVFLRWQAPRGRRFVRLVDDLGHAKGGEDRRIRRANLSNPAVSCASRSRRMAGGWRPAARAAGRSRSGTWPSSIH